MNSNFESSGNTYMANVYEKVKEILNNNRNKNNFRILLLSDGTIKDQSKTVNEAESVKSYIDKNNYSISVGTILYMIRAISRNKKAISSILRLNNSKTRVLTEVSSSDSNESISQKIYELFKDDFSEYNDIKFRIEPLKKGNNSEKLNEIKNKYLIQNNLFLEKVGIFEEDKLK